MMKKILSSIGATLQRGSLGLVIVGAAAAVVLVVSALLDPDRLYGYMLFGLIGAALTWRHFVAWRRRREQRGAELLGTEKELSSLYSDTR